MTTRTHVLHLITRLDQGGSAQNTVLCVIDQCRRYRVTLAYGRVDVSSAVEAEAIRRDAEMVRKAGARLVEVPSLRRHVGLSQDLTALMAVWRLLWRERPTIVHTHTSKAGAIGRLAAWLAGVPIIVHTPHGHVFYGYFSRRTSRAIALVERWLAALTDRLLVLTEQGIAEHVAVGVGRPDLFRVVPSGVSVSRFQHVSVDVGEVRRQLGVPVGGTVVMFVGRLVPVKGLRTLVEAIPRIAAASPDTVVVLVGTGPLQEELAQRAVQLGVADRLFFAGHRSDVPACLAAADIFVLPSLNEGMGRALVEAMMMGKPSVACRVGGIPAVLRHGENGLLVAPNDPDALAQAIVSLVDDAVLRRRLGDAARAVATQGYDTATMVRRVETVYGELLAEKGLA